MNSEISSANQRIPFVISAKSGLPVSVTSNSQSICLVSGGELVLVKAGRCVVTATQSGNSEYLPAEDRVLVIDLILSKKTTITCIKGKLTKKVTAVKPVCPAGYKKK